MTEEQYRINKHWFYGIGNLAPILVQKNLTTYKENKLNLSYFSESRLGSQKWKIIEKDVLNVYGHIMLIFMALLERL